MHLEEWPGIKLEYLLRNDMNSFGEKEKTETFTKLQEPKHS